MGNKINLIVPNEVQQTQHVDREGGETNANFIRKFFKNEEPVDIDKIKYNLDQCLDGIRDIMTDLKQRVLDGWQLDGVSISLAVSAEGSIGIATAGVEASIEVSFKPKA